ncbi:MAG: hypothetical protein KatS3mg033_0552 [Thermonema sp.]|uniref:hypothetical protein n=1 Tax=Thermonema TaxID=28194 RepID=UPI000571EABC|nr:MULTISPECIES: hypothetical protein [Thermonema]GIV38752.1 MAG: hypothetical protein KatS3mg033_0552 [Thermonema sp.]
MGWICIHCETHNFDNDHRCIVCNEERYYPHSAFVAAVKEATGAHEWEALYRRSEAKYKRLKTRHQKLKEQHQLLLQEVEHLRQLASQKTAENPSAPTSPIKKWWARLLHWLS